MQIENVVFKQKSRVLTIVPIKKEFMVMKNALKILVGIALIAMLFSCSTFTEKTSSETAEMTSFDKIALDYVPMSDLKILGNVEASRTLVYTLQKNGDFTIEMGDYLYVYTADTDSFEQTGTRYTGTLKSAPLITSAGSANIMNVSGGTDIFSMLLGGMAPSESAAPATISVRDVALDAVTYDLLKAAGKKGGVALLLPEYTWETTTEVTGTKMNLLGLYKSTTPETKVTTYTVTAKAAAVNF